jgi:competence protein ComEA
MSVRHPTPEPTAAELARRRLSLLGAELSPTSASRPGGPPPPDADAVPAAGPSVRDAGLAPARAGRHARPRLSWAGRMLGRAADAVPPRLHGRLAVTAQHVTVVALVLAAAMALAAWLVVRSEPEALPRRAALRLPAGVLPSGPDAPTPVTTPAAPAGALPAVAGGAPAAVAVPSAAVTGRVVVHVAGRVRRPGVLELPAGSRVVDAIEAAGGARPGAHLGLLNLARPLVDGEQIAVGVPGAAAAPPAGPVDIAGTATSTTTGTAGAPTALVNLNTASQAELEELPGVGPVTATSIIEWRTDNGAFSTVDELIEVSGIGEVTLAELRDLVTV